MRIRPIEQRSKREEGGFILVTTAMLFVTLLCFAGFTVDIGAWYARGNELQRVADASSLAGVVWMPDLTKATTVALETAAKNGVVPSATVSITVSPVTDNPHQLTVTITDTKAKQYFSQLVVRGKTITRSATAEYFLPIPLGSPTNYFGTGDTNSGTTPDENVWAAVNGYCAGHENGDLRLGRWDNSYSGSGYDCSAVNGTFASPDYAASGYLFAVDVPAGYTGGNIAVQVYDGAFKTGSGSIDNSLVSGSTIDTNFRVYHPVNKFSPFVTTGATFYTRNNVGLTSPLTVVSQDSNYAAGWDTVGTITSPVAGETYYLQVYTTAGQSHSEGSNSFGVRALTSAMGGTFAPCSTISGGAPAYSAQCVQVHGYQDLSLYASLDDDASATTATFYLAQVGPQYAGKIMTISLFDLGEGADKVEIIDPNGNAVVSGGTPNGFDWETDCGAPPAALPTCSANNVSSLDPSPQNSAYRPYPRISSRYVYNDRSVNLTVDLPTDYTSRYGTQQWWKIRYTIGSGATDRTTWSVNISGSPVHLVS
jgi:Flp pilus assembly protein TadG